MIKQFINTDNNKITIDEIIRLQKYCIENVQKDEIYNIRNDAKLRAVYTSQSYDEFK